MTKIIILCDQSKERINNLIMKVLNVKNIPEILILSSKDLDSKNFIDNQDFIIYNSDSVEFKNFIKDMEHKKTDFGFNENANFRASDVNITEEEINFKLNFKGSSVPIWLKNENSTNNADEIYAIFSAICVGVYLGMNIVEISENLKG
jgi:UDP-N-acetylmuramyl pentapeptide synthase